MTTICEISEEVLNPEFDEIREFKVGVKTIILLRWVLFRFGGRTIKVSEAINQCDRCDSVQLWASEMHWQDTMGDGVWHDHMQDFDAVCDDCFFQLKKEHKQIWNTLKRLILKMFQK